MSFFEQQINERRRSTDTAMRDALENLLVGVTGDDSLHRANASLRARLEIGKVMAYCGAKVESLEDRPHVGSDLFFDEDEVTLEEMIDQNLSSTGIMYRSVRLTSDFYKDAIGCFLALGIDGSPIALIPSNKGGYSYTDPKTGAHRQVNKDTVGSVITETAYCFYRPLPNEKLSVRNIVLYMLNTLDKRDYAIVLLTTLAVTLLGAMLPALNKFVFGPVVNAGELSLVLPVGVMFFSVTIAQLFIQANRSVVAYQVRTKLSMNMQAAMMMRILSLPASFFRTYSSGELASRFASATVVVDQLQAIAFGTTVTSVFSLIYILQLLTYSPLMVIPALISIAATFIANFLIARAMLHRTRKLLSLGNARSALELGTISAMQKIKLAGAEKRMFSIWANQYAKEVHLSYGHPGVAVLASPITVLVSALGTVLIYYFAIKGGVQTAAEYMAFTTAYGMVASAFATLNSSLQQMMAIRPHLEQLEPILETLPEVNENKYQVDSICGDISFQNVRFSYNGQAPYLFEGLNMNIQAGQHVAIVGKTGCGKSTLMRLMLGFEQPDLGAVTYDNYNLAKLDVDSLRRHIGVVLQDGTLFSGSLFANIAVSAPNMTMDEAWEVAEKAGIAEDIRHMPMGMMTMVGDEGRGISGGQRQRIMIARALAGNPEILLFDEATSALDNITQRQVTESLDALNCTRVVIAHRLSTVRNCDKIFVLDEGKIIEEGTYDELIALNGFFADLVARQQI